MNQIVINFEECSPSPSMGYNVFWRVAGSSDPLVKVAGSFFTSPAVFTDNTNPDGTEYEGVIVSNCRGGGGNQIFWTTIESSGSSSGSGGGGDVVYPLTVRAADGTATICDQIPILVYSLSPNIGIGAFIYFDAALTLPVDSFFYIIEGGSGVPGIIYECSTSGEIVANSGLTCS